MQDFDVLGWFEPNMVANPNSGFLGRGLNDIGLDTKIPVKLCANNKDTDQPVHHLENFKSMGFLSYAGPDPLE